MSRIHDMDRRVANIVFEVPSIRQKAVYWSVLPEYLLTNSVYKPLIISKSSLFFFNLLV